MLKDVQKSIWPLLKSLKNTDSLKQLLWSELNYERINREYSLRSLPDTITSYISGNPLLIAGHGDFNIFHIVLQDERLRLTPERLLINRLLKDHPYSLFIFSNYSRSHWHFVNVKYDKEAERRKLFRRITIGPDERLHTASERLAMLDLAGIDGDLFGISPLAIQSRHDEAFDVERVTKEFFDSYKSIFDSLWKYLNKETGDSPWAHHYGLQFMNRIMFLYFVQRKRWLGDDIEFVKHFWEKYQSGDFSVDTFFDQWLNELFFNAFNNAYFKRKRLPRHFPDDIREVLLNAPYLNGGLFAKNTLDEKYDGEFLIPDFHIRKIFDFFERYNFTIAEDSPLDVEVAVDPEMIGKVYESLVHVSEEAREQQEAGIFYTPRTEIDLMCRLSLVGYLANHIGDEYKNVLYEFIFALEHDEKEEADKEFEKLDLWERTNTLLREITVLDPAAGSGSFLVGMMKILDDLLERASRVLGIQETVYERRKRIIGSSLYGVDVMPWAVDVCELRLWLQLIIESDIEPAELHFRPLLPNLSFKIRHGDSLVQQAGGINFSHYKDTRTIRGEVRGQLTSLKGEKKKFFDSDPRNPSKYKTYDHLKRAELRLFRNILNARIVALEKDIKDKKIILDTEEKNIFGSSVRSAKGKVERKLTREIEDLAYEMETCCQARDALKKDTDVPFVWDVSFVEIFESDKRGFDIVIGNPPYVRQERIRDPLLPYCEWEELTDDAKRDVKKEYKAQLAASLYSAYPRFFGYSRRSGRAARPINAKNDLYVYFYFHGMSLLNKNGVFCFITSNSWLDVGFGKDLQEFLVKHSRISYIIDNQVKRSFAHADVNTVICLFSAPDESNENALDNTARFVMFNVPFENALFPVIFEEIDEYKERTIKNEYRVNPVKQKDLLERGAESGEEGDGKTIKRRRTGGPLIKVARYIGDKWGGKYLRAPDIYWRILEKGKGKLVRLGDIAEVRFGIKTGANDFFYLSKDRIREWGIEKEFLKPVIYSLKEIKYIEDNLKNTQFKILICNLDEKQLKDKAVFEYIKWGKMSNFHKRPSCSSRKPWYSIGRNWISAPFIFPAKVGERMVVLFNKKGYLEDKKLYGVTPSIGSNIYWATILNSSLTRFFMDLLCRQLTGAQAIADIDVRIVQDILVPFHQDLNDSYFKSVYNRISKREIKNKIEKEYRQEDRIELDNIIFDFLRINSNERKAIYDSIISLVKLRLDKAKSLK